jgi:hypothetical protein
VGKHAAGPPPDPGDELRELFQVEFVDEQGRRVGWKICASMLAAAAAAWAVATYTEDFLGPWRFLLVALIGLYAAYLGFFVMLFLAAELAVEAAARRLRRRAR